MDQSLINHTMIKNYFIILEKHSSDPVEARQSEADYSDEKYAIHFDGTEEGELRAGLSAPSMLAAIGRALELRDHAVGSGQWDIIGTNYKNSFC